jgi:hypothetical protein
MGGIKTTPLLCKRFSVAIVTKKRRVIFKMSFSLQLIKRIQKDITRDSRGIAKGAVFKTDTAQIQKKIDDITIAENLGFLLIK